MPNKIVLKGDPIYKERNAGAAGILPGDLLDIDTSGDVIVHADQGQNAVPRFAIEDRDIGEDIDHAYGDTERVHYVHARPGDEIYAWLKDGQTSVINGELESNGDGKLRVHTPQAVNEGGSATYTIYVNAVVAVALEAVAASGSDERVRVEVV